LERKSGRKDAGAQKVRRCVVQVVVDPYTHNRITGSFVLVDERTNATLAGGMVGKPTFAS